MLFVRCCNVYVLRSSSYRWRPPTSIDGDSLFMVWAVAQAVRPGLTLSLGLPARFIRTLADWLCLYACTACVRYVVVQATETCDSAPGRGISSDGDETGQTAGMNNPNPIQSNPILRKQMPYGAGPCVLHVLLYSYVCPVLQPGTQVAVQSHHRPARRAVQQLQR